MPDPTPKHDDGGPAYPSKTLVLYDPLGMEHETPFSGMSLHAHYAGLAMQGALSNPNLDTADPDELAVDSLRCADAMVAAYRKREADNA